jgi:D-arabinose 1-dehydrogenase-like Zn-dependent alcohol dehydrogenase
MRAVLLHDPKPLEQHPLAVTRVERPEPGPVQVLVKGAACRVCRSNPHMI